MYEVRLGDLRSVFEMDLTREGRTIRLGMRIHLYKGRFVKVYAKVITIVEGDYSPWVRIQEFFQYLRRPEVINGFLRECEADEMRREGYYRAMDQIGTASTVW